MSSEYTNVSVYFLLASDGVTEADADLEDLETLFDPASGSPFSDAVCLLSTSSSSPEIEDPADTFSPRIFYVHQ